MKYQPYRDVLMKRKCFWRTNLWSCSLHKGHLGGHEAYIRHELKPENLIHQPLFAPPVGVTSPEDRWRET